jgi:hypothetical protein
MAFDKFLIGPPSGSGAGFETGWQTNLRPFLINDDAFAQMENAYVFRGRIIKRFGSVYIGYGNNPLLSRLRINIGTTDGSGNFSATVPGIIFGVGQAFSIGTELLTVQALGTPVVILSTTGVSATHTYNTTTGALVIVGAAVGASVYFYPAEPVMGLTVYENGPVFDQPSYAFDTQFAYIYIGGSWQLSPGSPTWHGTDLDFFWTSSYRYAGTGSIVDMFVTNFYVVNPNGAVDASDDPIYYLNSVSGAWTAFQPQTKAAGDFVETCSIIVQFQGRLVLLNTVEVDSTGATNSNYRNRCRFSSRGDPTNAAAFLEITQVGAIGGGVIDAPTSEAIMTAEFIKDRLIVYFERSTWELKYTGNSVQPFEWGQLNTELGSESTFSVVPFDKEVLAIGSTGVHSCNGVNVDRIDNNIPDEIFSIQNNNGATARVCGIRDYFQEMVYWAYPSDNETVNETFPNKVLVFNYKNKSWSRNDDCITAFGYFEQGVALTWENSIPTTWAEETETWEEQYQQTQSRQVLAGNQEGFTFLIIPQEERNAAVMQLSNATLAGTTLTLTIVNHTLQVSNQPDNGDYISIENAVGSVNLNGLIFPINTIVDLDTVTVQVPSGFTLGGAYLGGGVISRVSNIKLRSRQWNPYDKNASNFYLARIDFAVEKTEFGEITVDYFPSASQLSMIQAGVATTSIMGNNILETFPYDATLYPFEQYQDRLWHAIYFQTTGECIQIYMFMSDVQMRNPAIVWSDFELDALILHASRSASSRLQ